MKRFLSILLAVVMVMSLAVPAFAYSDTAESDHANAITHLSGLGVISGYDDGTFKPEKVVTRAEMAKMLVVCLGLESGASLLEGQTEYSDVPSTHWATGYIAVASQYGLIKGDGNGTFRPDDTVNYAEAATMVLRALGYNRIVDKTGEWPTNYLNKATELRIFDGVELTKATAGAARGPIAQMMWNMMNTKMWDVGNESEGDGLTYGKTITMLATKYPNFTFREAIDYNGYRISNDGEEFTVEVSLGGTPDWLEYEANNFFMLPTGIEVEVLVNTKTDKVVSMFVTDEQYIAEGTEREVKDAHINSNLAGTYGAVAFTANTKSAAIVAGTTNVDIDGIADSKVVEKIDVGTKTTKITYNQGTGMSNDSTTSFKNDDVEEQIGKGLYIIDGERATVADLKVGDVVTQISGKDRSVDEDDLYVVSSERVSGSYDELVIENVIDNAYAEATIGGEAYDVTTAEDFANAPVNDFIYELDEDDDEVAVTWANFIDEDEDTNKYLGEDITLFFNAFGDVVKALFGEVDDVVTDGSLYVLPGNNTWSVSDSEGAIEYVKLVDETGSKNYVIAEDAVTAVKAIVNAAANKGAVVYAEFNNDDEVTKLTLLTALTFDVTSNLATAMDKVAAGVTYVTGGMTDPDAFETVANPGATFDKDTNYFGTYKISASTVVFTLKQLEDEDNAGKYLSKFTLDVTKGSEALKNVATAKAIVFTEDGETVKAQYVVVLGTSESDNQYGIIEKITVNGNKTYYTIDGEKYEQGAAPVGTPAVGDFVIYTVKDEKVNIKDGKNAETLKADTYKVTDVSEEFVTVNGTTYDLDIIADEETTGGQDFADFKAFNATIDYADLDKDGTVESDESYFDSIEEIDLDEIKAKEGNAFYVDGTNKLVVVISGYDR